MIAITKRHLFERDTFAARLSPPPLGAPPRNKNRAPERDHDAFLAAFCALSFRSHRLPAAVARNFCASLQRRGSWALPPAQPAARYTQAEQWPRTSCAPRRRGPACP